MCKILKISHSTYYSYEETEAKRDKINDIVVKIFNENQHVYGTRKLKVELAKKTTKYRGGVLPRLCVLMDWCRPTRSKNTDIIKTR